MKKIIFVFGLMLALAACTNSTKTNDVPVVDIDSLELVTDSLLVDSID